MPIEKALKLTDGHNDVVRSDLIGDGQVKDSQNYEVLGDGDLTLRKEAEVYSTSLNTYISSTLGMAVVHAISPPFYPPNKPTDMVYGEFMLVIYGTLTAGGSYEMYLVYEKTAGVWTHLTGATNLLQGLTDAGVDWTSDCDPEFSIGSNRIVITDGVNRAYYIAVDADGDVQSSILGIPSPTNKPYMTPAAGYDASDYTIDSNNYVTVPGLVQVSYTAVTEDGLESNPSPLSDTLDLQWFNLDANENDGAWIAKINVSNLTVPDVAQDILDDLKYFKLYIRTLRNSGGTIPQNLEFVQQFEILNKAVSSSDLITESGNSYAVTLEPAEGTIISYENDIAPIASHNAQNGGVIMLGGTKSYPMIGYPWVFGYYHEIKLNNQNAETFVDAVIQIQLDDEDVGGADDITNLDWDYYSSNPGVAKGMDQNLNALRIYDTDGITPLQVVWNDAVIIGNSLKAFVRIPQLSPGTHSIYLCFSGTGSPGAGVTNAHYQDGYNGEFLAATSDYVEASALMFTLGEKSKRLTSYITSQCENVIVSDEVPNKSDYGVPGDLGLASISAGSIAAVPALDYVAASPPNWFVDANKVVFTASHSNYIRYDASNLGLTPQKGTVYFRTAFFRNGFNSGTDHMLFGVEPGTTTKPPEVSLWLHYDVALYGGAGGWYLAARVASGAASSTFYDFTNLLTFPDTASTNYYIYFMAFSWDNDAEVASLFLYDLEYGVTPFTYEEVSTRKFQEASLTDGKITFGLSTSSAVNILSGIQQQEYDQIQMISDLYLNGSNQADRSAVWNLLNFQPFARNPIGYYQATDAQNQNITFTETKEFETKDEDNKLRWSDVNGVNFPDLYTKRLREPLNLLAPAPSFLKFQYENTMIILTRNTINRFIMEGDPNTWAGDPNRLVQEAENYGLYAKKSFSRAGERLLWMGEDGIILWDTQGLNKISQNVIKIPLDTDSNFSGFFQPIRDQYILHNFSTDLSYALHFKGGMFYKFKALDFDRGIARVLSGGTLAENINLLISDNRDIYKYPGLTDTTETAFVKSKDFNHRWAEFLRWIVEFDGNADVDTHVTSDILQSELMPNQVDRDFSGANAWTNVDLDSFSASGVLDLSAIASGQYCYCPVASMPMTVGIEYTLQFGYTVGHAGTWILQDDTGGQEYGRVSTTKTGHLITFTPSIGGGLRIVATGVFDGSFDNFSLKTKDQVDSKTPTSGVWNWITNGKALGAKISFTIDGAKTIKYLIYEYLNRGGR